MAEFLKLPGVDRSLIARVVAGYLVFTGILGICGGIALFIGGAAAGIGAVIGGSAGGLTELSQAALEAAATQGTMTEGQFQEAQATMQAGIRELQSATQEMGGLAGISALLICFAFSVSLPDRSRSSWASAYSPDNAGRVWEQSSSPV